MNKIKKDGFKLIGLKLDHKTTNENGQSGMDCGSLWQQFEAGNFAEKIPEKLSDEIYAVYYDYEGDHTKPFAYFIGCKVNMDAQTVHNMDSLIIPAGSYYTLLAEGKMPGCVADCWRKIWSSVTGRAYQFDFEIYDERSKDWNNARVEIFISTNE